MLCQELLLSNIFLAETLLIKLLRIKASYKPSLPKIFLQKNRSLQFFFKSSRVQISFLAQIFFLRSAEIFKNPRNIWSEDFFSISNLQLLWRDDFWSNDSCPEGLVPFVVYSQLTGAMGYKNLLGDHARYCFSLFVRN